MSTLPTATNPTAPPAAAPPNAGPPINVESLAREALEGFYVTAAKPTLAQRNAKPGNIRRWRDARGRPYPTHRGYVDFVAWASERFPGASREEMSRRAIEEGWRILRVLVGQYLDGRYTQGKPPSAEEMFRVFLKSTVNLSGTASKS